MYDNAMKKVSDEKVSTSSLHLPTPHAWQASNPACVPRAVGRKGCARVVARGGTSSQNGTPARVSGCVRIEAIFGTCFYTDVVFL
jgi:hypothetical protein